jgi:hypothetical protein
VRAIFISYRRSDSEGEAGRLSDVLTARFSDQSVFMDVDSIKPGRDFRRAIEESIQGCSVLLAIVGPSWAEAQNDQGGRRLDAPNDYVRLEIAAALRRDIPVIPVLVRGARMPHPEQLPAEIEELAYRNSVELTHARWRSDLQVLIEALEPLLHHGEAEATPAVAPAAHAAPRFVPLPPVDRPHLTPRGQGTIAPRRPASSPFTTPTYIRPVKPAPASPPQYLPPRPLPAAPMAPEAAPTVRQAPGPGLAAGPGVAAGPGLTAGLGLAAGLAPGAVDHVAKHLAHFIGPIAEIVVKRAARTAPTLESLCQAVADEIESGGDRARFLTACQK